jgi:hypothetical protein
LKSIRNINIRILYDNVERKEVKGGREGEKGYKEEKRRESSRTAATPVAEDALWASCYQKKVSNNIKIQYKEN